MGLGKLHHQVTFAINGEASPIFFAVADVIEMEMKIAAAMNADAIAHRRLHFRDALYN